MAQATHTPAVTRNEIVEVTPEGVTLFLSMEEASALVAVCRRVSGSPVRSRRKYLSEIFVALLKAKVQHIEGDIEPASDVCFKDSL